MVFYGRNYKIYQKQIEEKLIYCRIGIVYSMIIVVDIRGEDIHGVHSKYIRRIQGHIIRSKRRTEYLDYYIFNYKYGNQLKFKGEI